MLALVVLTVACSAAPSATTNSEADANNPSPVVATTSSPPTAADNIRRTEILIEIQHQDLTVVIGDIEVIFDQWFFSTFDPEARVTVRGPEGVLTEGLVTGPDAVMTEIPDVGFAFYDGSGNEVARISHADLGAAADKMACDAGVTC